MSDISIGVVVTPNVQQALNAANLISFESKDDKGKFEKLYFITTDKFTIENGFVRVRGFFTPGPETKVISEYVELVSTSDKSSYAEITIPWDKIFNIRNLAYKSKK